MSQITQSQKDSLEIMTTSNTTILPTDNQETSTTGHVIFSYFSKTYAVHPGMKSIGNIIADFVDETPDFEQDLQEGRKWVAEEFYPSESTLKKIRLERGLSQKEVADRMGTQQPYIARIESKPVEVTVTTIEKLALVYDISPSKLFEIIRCSKLDQ